MDQVLELKGVAFTPASHDSAAKHGWILVTCANEQTADSLRTNQAETTGSGIYLRFLKNESLVYLDSYQDYYVLNHFKIQ